MGGLDIGKVKAIFHALVFFALGSAMTVIFKKYSFFYLSNEISFTDVLTLFATVILTIYIVYLGGVLQDKQDNTRATKDTIINYYSEYISFLDKKIHSIMNNSMDQSKVNANFKILRVRFHKLADITKEHNFIGSDDLTKQIFKEITFLWTTFTNGTNITNTSVQELIELRLIKIEGLIYDLVLVINKS